MTVWMTAALAAVMVGQESPEPVMSELRKLVGGTWKNGPVEQEFTEEKGTIRGLVVVARGTPNEFKLRPTLGWDDRAKKVFYLDDHGGKSVYFGHIVKNGDRLFWEFESIVGTPGKWRLWTWFAGPDEYCSKMDEWKDGKWSTVSKLSTLKRSR